MLGLFGPLGGQELLSLLVMTALWIVVWVVPFWKIFSKAGFPGALSLLMLIPVVQIVVLFVVAFSRWPALERAGAPPHQQ
jgi:hypothetical protein